MSDRSLTRLCSAATPVSGGAERASVGFGSTAGTCPLAESGHLLLAEASRAAGALEYWRLGDHVVRAVAEHEVEVAVVVAADERDR